MIGRAIEELLFREIGLQSSSVGLATIEAAVRCRMAECGTKDQNAYYKRLISSRNELDSLIDEVTVPETWFFRDKEPFGFLLRYINAKWSGDQCKQPLRVLSVPCSSGEEPFSIAISLLEAGLREEQICLDAVDINRHALEKAKNGVYGKNSFRDSTFHKFIHYFQMISENEYAVRNNIMRIVNFIHDNILKNSFLAGHGAYDIIFCRNLLIYMESEARQTTLRTLKKLLKNDGLLFVGHAEALPIVDAVFHPLRENGAFAYSNSKLDDKTQFKRSTITNGISNQTNTLVGEALSSPLPGLLSDRKSGPANKKTMHSHDDSSLTKAEILAKDGRLKEAEDLCHTHIEKDPLSAKAFFILGIIAQTKGDLTLAEDHLQKVIYLNPEHEQAMLHLALIYDGRGDLERAQDIRHRKKLLKEKYL